MIFLWSHLLWLLLAMPALAVLYLYLLRGKRSALRYPNVALVLEVMGRGNRWRRHVPPLIFLGGLLALVLAIARPAADLPVTAKERTIILAIDVSLSMKADDIAPSRLVAAQETARKFIASLPPDVRVGIVAFSTKADIVQVPTRNRFHLARALDRLQPDSGTGIGTGIIAALISLFPDDGLENDYDIFGMGGMRDGNRVLDVSKLGGARKNAAAPVPPGSNPSAVIILLTDGRNTIGKQPRAVAQMAVDRGIRIYTIGFGTPEGKTVAEDGKMLEAGLDEDVLRDVAYATRGTYFKAASRERLNEIYSTLDGQLVREFRQTEITARFIAAAAILLLAAAALSVAWFPRPA